ncbi:MAG TPA: UDP-N-acetylglucosamine 2-epimerase (non-hydrolyzing) [Clostridia bacterium]|nr:UDP-N-acetylglucosamine 2-epimerase (non-hydrolyzing) [Clostridia bacterium]
MRLLHVVGARPNFMKVSPVWRALSTRNGVEQVLVHTGQHYDVNMSGVFFQQLSIPAPDVNLGVGSGSHAQQTAEIMASFEKVVVGCRPDLVLVYGDVNSTVAAALVCSKLQIRVAHVEAGLRAFDRTMPEEINRVVTDQLSDLLFTPSADANANLEREGIASGKIHFVGNVMIDTLINLLPQAERLPANGVPRHYILLTLHRPSNVDDASTLRELLEALVAIGNRVPIIFPVHPRTRQRIDDLGFKAGEHRGILLFEPKPYLDFLNLQRRATAVITDSGGIQEETTYLGVPCLTVRENTERPITITMGTNTLVGRDFALLRGELERILDGHRKPHQVPPLWDGQASERIAGIITG